MSNCEKSDFNIDKVAKARIIILFGRSQSGRGKRGESAVQSEYEIKLSRKGVFFWYQISGHVVFSETESVGHDPRRCD
jgi:hypothetical protein